MDPAPFVVAAVIAVFAVAILRIVTQGQKRRAAWKTLAKQLGLRHEGSVLIGETEGVPVRIAMETRRNPDGYDQLCIVSAEIPGTLPLGFVAAPRRWMTGLDRMLTDNVVASDDPALKECYIFQSAQPQEGQALIGDAEVQKSLLELYSPLRVGFVEKGRTHVAYRSWLSNAEEARSALKDVVQAARTLAAAQARLEPSPEHRQAD